MGRSSLRTREESQTLEENGWGRRVPTGSTSGGQISAEESLYQDRGVTGSRPPGVRDGDTGHNHQDTNSNGAVEVVKDKRHTDTGGSYLRYSGRTVGQRQDGVTSSVTGGTNVSRVSGTPRTKTTGQVGVSDPSGTPGVGRDPVPIIRQSGRHLVHPFLTTLEAPRGPCVQSGHPLE